MPPAASLLFKWEGLLHRKTREFLNPELEREYIKFKVEALTPRLKSYFLLVSRFWGLWAAFTLLSFWGSEDQTYLPIMFVAYMILCIMCLMAYYGLCHKLQWFFKGNRCEDVCTYMMAFSACISCLTSHPWTYTNPFDHCWKNKSEDGTEEECDFNDTLGVWMGLSSILFLMPWAVFIQSVFLEKLFRIFLVFHVLRSLILTPFPPGYVWTFGTMCYILNPFVFHHLFRGLETSRRQLYLLQRDTEQKNEALQQEVEEARSAALRPRFELPTTKEMELVTGALQEAGEAVLGVEVPFEVLVFKERIGAGGFGEVFKADYSGTMVAVKRLGRNHIKQEYLKALLAEIAMLRNLRHPNIVQFVGASWDSIANFCMIMEYMERGTLSDALFDNKLALSWQDPLLKMVTDVLCGLAYLHSRRPTPVIHRDMKPDNVLITSTFGCKLGDFGTAREVMKDETMTMVGSLHYMAPEVLIGYHYDESADIYAMGMIMLVMHTRQKPYQGGEQGRQHVIPLVAGGNRPPIPSDMPASLARLVEACWVHEPADRPTSATVLRRIKSCVLVYNDDDDDDGGGGPRPASAVSVQFIGEEEGWGEGGEGAGEVEKAEGGVRGVGSEEAEQEAPGVSGGVDAKYNKLSPRGGLDVGATSVVDDFLSVQSISSSATIPPASNSYGGRKDQLEPLARLGVGQ